MNANFHFHTVENLDVSVDVFKNSPRPWATIRLGRDDNATILYLSYDQLSDIVTKASNAMMFDNVDSVTDFTTERIEAS